MKYNNRILSFVFLGLLVLVVLTRWVKSSSGQQSFKSILVSVDTSQVVSFVISPQVDKPQEVKMIKKNKQWYLQKDGQEIELDNDRIQGVLGQIARLQVLRLAARSKDKWKDYELEDATATRLKVLGVNNTELLNLLVGKAGFEGYDQFSYVRLQGEDEVYAVKALFSQELNQKMNDWRDQTFIKFSPPDIRKLEFKFPEDSSFSMNKNEISWQINGSEADSAQTARIQNYLQEISNLSLDSFEDKLKPGGNPLMRLNMEGVNMKPIVIQVFATQKPGDFLLTSSLNPKAFFRSNSEGDFGKIFQGKSAFEE